MPTTIKIPARVESHCEPCEYHKLIGSFHVRIGPGGWREYTCVHPEAFEPLPPTTDPELAQAVERLRAKLNEGRYIGKTERQPEWCPLRRTEQNCPNSR
jgi:hypothetical protein